MEQWNLCKAPLKAKEALESGSKDRSVGQINSHESEKVSLRNFLHLAPKTISPMNSLLFSSFPAVSIIWFSTLQEIDKNSKLSRNGD